MASWTPKDPDSVLDYAFDIPLDTGDSVASYLLEKLSGTVIIDSDSRTDARVTAWLSGGTDGETNVFRMSWVTTGGREDDAIITLAVVANDVLALEGYANPTAAHLVAMFPKFAAVDLATVEMWLVQARRSVDSSWTEGDYAMGQMLLAAHYMVLEGMGTGTEAELASKGMAGLKSVRSGSFAFERADSASSRNSLASTSYGERFMALARVNVGGPRVTDTGTLPTGTWPYA